MIQTTELNYIVPLDIHKDLKKGFIYFCFNKQWHFHTYIFQLCRTDFVSMFISGEEPDNSASVRLTGY